MARKKATATAVEQINDKDAKKEAMERAVKEVHKEFGEEALLRPGERPIKNINVISSGNLALDLAIGVGGIPRGRIIEIYGPESSGKTTVALHVIAESQKNDGICAFIDAEHALDPVYAKNIGVKVDELYISQPDSGEQALEIAETLIRSGAVDVLVIDSVAALVPKQEIEGEMGASFIGVQARLMSQALRKLSGIVNKTDSVVIFINQLREKVGVMFGNPETTPGGRALKFYSSVRLDVRRTEQIKVGQDVVGNRVKVKVAKNKVAPPFRTCEFDILFGEGISKEGTLLDMAVERDLIKKSGAWFSYDDQKIGQGRDNARMFLKNNPDIAEKIDGIIRSDIAALGQSSSTYDDSNTELVDEVEERDPDFDLLDDIEA